MRTGKYLCAAICFVLAGSAARAETGFYAGVAIAKPDYEVGPGSGPASANLISWSYADGDLGWAVSSGYRLNKYLAAELNYLNFGTFTETAVYRFNLGPTFRDIGQEIELSVGGLRCRSSASCPSAQDSISICAPVSCRLSTR